MSDKGDAMGSSTEVRIISTRRRVYCSMGFYFSCTRLSSLEMKSNRAEKRKIEFFLIFKRIQCALLVDE